MDAYDKHRAQIRRDGMSVTPYRLGMAIADAGDDLPCPYSHPRSVRCFNEGIRWVNRFRLANGEQSA